MCGRFTLAARPADLARSFPSAGGPAPDRPERYNLAPTDPVLTLTAKGWEEMRWGLVPSWAESPKAVGAKYLNARLETLREKPLFREAFAQRRCLLPASGFYEWRREGKLKQPFLLRPPQGLLAMAGLWAAWRRGEERVVSCSVITRPAEGPIAAIHDRMPLLVPGEAHRGWLEGPQEMEQLLSLHVELEMMAVSDYVNSVKNEGPRCIERV